jgi:hypothetical protein
MARVRYLAVRGEHGIRLERLAVDWGVPRGEECSTVVVAGLDAHEVLAREGAEVHFAAHPTRERVVVWAVSDSSIAGAMPRP